MRLGLLVLALALVPAAQAYAEADAPSLDDRVLAAWHEPGDLAEGQQWRAYLQLRPDANVTAVGFQACLVPGACILSPRPATALGNGTWVADTAAHPSPINGKPYPWPAGELGVTWFLAADGGNLTFAADQALPRGIDPSDPSCDGRATDCLRTHYLVFTASTGAKGAPGPTFALLAVAFVVAALARSRHG